MSIRHGFRAYTGTPLPPLRITTTTIPGKARILRLDGEVDQHRRLQLREALAQGVKVGPPRLVVDLSGLTFCDSTGLNALLQTRLDADAAGVLLLLAAPTAQLLRLLDVTGAQELFTIRPSVPAALADGFRPKGR
ncbi:STAS domain-containing protein [Streptomyces sp. CBMA123]|uniref:STAS domain-containing protein n=1 Tax=Streptomyces sp. CBMA123 TaxID=1896313 RepID=UPI001661E8B9|nr:STAS domain-containing protein [Streptomyces sp. CBMA123]MBD0694747.1 hypothetical protein [Streptomyces sp. CBMA123]